MKQSEYFYVAPVKESLCTVLEHCDYDNIFILVDAATQEFCLPKLDTIEALRCAHIISIPEGDEHKTLNTLTDVWAAMSENKGSRKSILINLGGGLVTDLGGFAASTFKRGIRFINIPTTLLGAIDAATGGKTGVNFLSFKNEIGTFQNAIAVIIDVDFFETLDSKNLLSGFAEMVKHGLIGGTQLYHTTLNFDIEHFDINALKTLVLDNMQLKYQIVKDDPNETGVRKALNFGHTVGHAFETLSYHTPEPLAHGYAIMWGMVCELYLSLILCGFPKQHLWEIQQIARNFYGNLPFSCKDYDALIELMSHDKKNESGIVNFTLLANIGDVRINQTASREQIIEALDFVM